MKNGRYRRNVKLSFTQVVSTLLTVSLLAIPVSTQTTSPRGQSVRLKSQTSIDCTESVDAEDARGRMHRSSDDVRRCRESLRKSDAPKRAVNRQRTGRVTVTEIGPEGGASFSKAGFIFNGEGTRQIILPGSRIFRSLNGGRNWSPVSPIIGGTGGIPSVVRQDPHNLQVLLAAMDNDGLVYRSEDFGTTWTALEATFFLSAVDLAISQTSSNVILFLDLSNGIWRSNDGGTTVEYQPDTGLPTPKFDWDTFEIIASPTYTSIETTPADPNIVYVVINDDPYGYYAPGIFKSIDGGETFARLPGSSPHPWQVFPHPTNPNVLYVKDLIESDPFSSPRIYRSIDGGASFNPVTTGVSEDLFDTFVAFDSDNPSFVYVAGATGFFRSTDDGISFQRLGLTAEQVGVGATTASVDPTNPNVLYVNTSRGNFTSVNGGERFTSISNGWRSVFINDMTFDNDKHPSLYVVAQEGIGILKTRTRGKHYEQIPDPIDPFDPQARVRRLAISPTNPNMIFAGTLARGLFRTTNGGRSWTQSSVDTGHDQFHQTRTQIAVDPLNPNNVFFATRGGFFSFGFPGFYRSTDGGTTFQRTMTILVDALVIDPPNPNVIYAGSSSPSNFLFPSAREFGPIKSVDGGLSFSNGPIYSARVTRIVIDPINSNNLYLAGNFQFAERIFAFHQVVRSTDGGVTYSAADASLPRGFVQDIAIDPRDPARLYAWTSEGLFISTDRATTWTLLAGLEAFKTAGFLNRLTINPKKPNLLYLWGSSVVEVEIKHEQDEAKDGDDQSVGG